MFISFLFLFFFWGEGAKECKWGAKDFPAGDSLRGLLRRVPAREGVSRKDGGGTGEGGQKSASAVWREDQARERGEGGKARMALVLAEIAPEVQVSNGA